MKATLAVFIARMLPREISWSRPPAAPCAASQLLECGHRANDLGDLAGAAVKGAMPHRHPTIAADRQTGLDLLEIWAAVLGLAPARRRKARLGIVVGAIQRDQGQVPLQPGHVNAEHCDRLGRRPPPAARP
jgi:hypothetical protein